MAVNLSTAEESLQASLENLATRNGVKSYSIGNITTTMEDPEKVVNALLKINAVANRTLITVGKFGKVR